MKRHAPKISEAVVRAKFVLSLVLLIQICPPEARSQDSGPTLSWNNFGVESGLISNEVYSTFRSQNGVLWVGTRSGINYWTGESLASSNLLNSQNSALKDDWIYSIVEMNPDTLLVGSHLDGLYLLDTHSVLLRPIEPSSECSEENAAIQVQKITPLQDGSFAIGTGEGGGWRLSQDLELCPMLFSGQWADKIQIIRAFLEEDRGNIWIGTWRNGLYRASHHENDPQSVVIEEKIGLPASFIRTLFIDTNSTLWIGTSGAGLLSYSLLTGKIEEFSKNSPRSPKISDSVVESFIQIRENMYLVGTWEGLNLLDVANENNHVIRHDTDNSNTLANNVINHIAIDDYNTLWISHDGGFSFLDLIQFEIEEELTRGFLSDDESVIHMSLSDYQNSIIVGTESSLVVYDSTGSDRTSEMVLIHRRAMPKSCVWKV